MGKSITISDAELEVIEVLWQANTPLSAFEIRKQMNNGNQWERTTILTLIRRLVEKDILCQEKREVYYYSPNITKDAYIKEETKHFLQKLYQGKSKELIAALFQDENLTAEDLEELKIYFKKKGAEHGT